MPYMPAVRNWEGAKATHDLPVQFESGRFPKRPDRVKPLQTFDVPRHAVIGHTLTRMLAEPQAGR